MKTLNRLLAQDNSLNLCSITDCWTSTKKKGGQRQWLLWRGDTENTGTCHWAGVYWWNHQKWPQSSNPFSAASYHTAPESRLAVRQHCKGKWQISLHLSLQQECILWYTSGISSNSPISDAAILGEWQGNSPSGCCLLTISPHVTIIAAMNVPLKLMFGFYPNTLLTALQLQKSSAEKSNHLTNFVTKLLATKVVPFCASWWDNCFHCLYFWYLGFIHLRIMACKLHS